MGYQAQIILAAIICGAVITVITSVKGKLLAPVKSREGVSVFSVIVISGEAEGLEETVNGLIWLRDTGRAYTDIIIAADDAEPEALYRADRLARRAGGCVCDKDGVCAVIAETVKSDGGAA